MLIAILTIGTLRPAQQPARDLVLARSHIIAVAQWEGADIEPATSVYPTFLYRQTTKIHILRVIAGPAKEGVCEVALGPNLAPDGKSLWQGTSIVIRRIDCRKPNLWFLNTATDPKTGKTVFALGFLDEIAEPNLESFYTTLRQREFRDSIDQFLDSADDKEYDRALKMINGDRDPWPFGDERAIDSMHPPIGRRRWASNRSTVLTEYAGEVRALLDKVTGIRRQRAAACFVNIARASDITRVRGLLTDRDALIRAIAARYLIMWHDQSSIEGIAKFLPSLDRLDGTSLERQTASDALQKLESWHDDRFVPGLIRLLKEPKPHAPGEVPLPLEARYILDLMTDYRFPLDAKKSLDAWNQVVDMPPDARKQELQRILGNAN